MNEKDMQSACSFFDSKKEISFFGNASKLRDLTN